MLSAELLVSMYTTKIPIDMCRFKLYHQLTKILAFSVKDRFLLTVLTAANKERKQYNFKEVIVSALKSLIQIK
jgi:hypothetical protein